MSYDWLAASKELFWAGGERARTSLAPRVRRPQADCGTETHREFRVLLTLFIFFPSFQALAR